MTWISFNVRACILHRNSIPRRCRCINHFSRWFSVKRQEGEGAKASPEYTTGTSPPRARSFLLDPPTKPPSKRSKTPHGPHGFPSDFEQRFKANPYAQVLASPLRQCLYMRCQYPSALMVKLILAAPVDPMGDREEHHEAQVQPLKATGTKKVRKGNQNNPEACSWIVSDRILPRSLLPEETPEKRHGLGKWVISRPAVIQAMIREGRFKVIHPTAYIRPDILQVMYAHFTMAAVSSIQERLAQYRQMFLLPNLAGRKSTENTNASHGRSEAMQKIPPVCLDQVRQAIFKTDDAGSSVALEKREVDMPLHLTLINEASSKLRDQIHCVLRFDNVSVEDLLAALEKQPYGSLPLHKLSLADIALPPSTLTSNLVLENVTISTSNELDGEHRQSNISVPCFNMHELFGHHCRRGYEIILHACTDTLALQQLLLEKRVSSRSKRAEMLAEARRHVVRLICDVNVEKRSDDRETLWIVVRQHEHTTPWILLLWKMYLGLPKTTTQS